jgi:hypothetical protein
MSTRNIHLDAEEPPTAMGRGLEEGVRVGQGMMYFVTQLTGIVSLTS